MEKLRFPVQHGGTADMDRRALSDEDLERAKAEGERESEPA
jgi:hypothetical protein